MEQEEGHGDGCQLTARLSCRAAFSFISSDLTAGFHMSHSVPFCRWPRILLLALKRPPSHSFKLTFLDGKEDHVWSSPTRRLRRGWPLGALA